MYHLKAHIKLKGFGMQVYDIMQMILGRELVLVWSPRVMLLSDFECCKMGSSKVLIANMLAAATTLIASKWKSSDPPAVGEWLSKIKYMRLMGKLSTILQLQSRLGKCIGGI